MIEYLPTTILSFLLTIFANSTAGVITGFVIVCLGLIYIIQVVRFLKEIIKYLEQIENQHRVMFNDSIEIKHNLKILYDDHTKIQDYLKMLYDDLQRVKSKQEAISITIETMIEQDIELIKLNTETYKSIVTSVENYYTQNQTQDTLKQ